MAATLDGMPLLDPVQERRHCEAMGVDCSAWWGLANSFRVPLRWNPAGDPWGLGTVLMHASHYARLLSTADLDDLTLRFIDARGTSITFQNLSLIGPERTPIGDRADAAAAVVLTLADRRYRLCQIPVDRQYNTRDAAGDYVTASLNSGTAWTWDTLVADLWAKMFAVYADLGATPPAFPSAPSGAPEGFYFYGAGNSAWACLDRVAEAAGHFLRWDPTTGTADLLDPAGAVVTPTTAESRLRIADSGLVTPGSPPLPEKVRVSFPVPGTNSRASFLVSVGGSPAGTILDISDDTPTLADGTDPDGNLAIRAAAVAPIWEFDFTARFAPRLAEFAGVVDYVRRANGTPYFASWSVQDSCGHPGRPAVVSACASGDVWRDRLGTRLATGGSPGTLNVVTNVCPVLDGYGDPTGDIIVESRSVTFPPGTVFGEPSCVTNPSGCCPWAYYCVDGVCTVVFDDETPPTGSVGPFATEQDCLDADCEDTSTIAVSCDPNPAKKVLYATVAGFGTYLLVHNGTYWEVGTQNEPACAGAGFTGDWVFWLYCTETSPGVHEWEYRSNGTTVIPTVVSTSPFELTGSIQLFLTAGTSPCNLTSYTVTVTD